jgi:hypothetical protein
VAVTQFTMQDVVDGVLNEMRFAPGRDVQIHLQSSIVQDASMFYRAMMMKYIWRDFMTIFETDIDGTTGRPVSSMVPYIDRFSNILAVYKDKETYALPFAPALTNPAQYNRSAITPAPAPYIFQIWPHKAMHVIVQSRMFKDSDFDLDDPVPFYKDILVIGTSLALATKSGINMELVGLLKQQLSELIDMYTLQEIKSTYQVNPQFGSIPTEWYSYDN